MSREAHADWVKPQVLRALREQAGLTPEAVAQASRRLSRRGFATVDAAAVKQWEEGLSEPELEHLETLSELYGCPVGQFFLAHVRRRRLPLSFRGLAAGKEKHFSPATRLSLWRFVELAEWFATLLDEHEIEWKVEVLSARGGPVDPRGLADRLRRQFGFSETVRHDWSTVQDAYDWWRRRIEVQGVFCLELKLDPKDVRGASRWVKGRYPFILVNRQDVEAGTGRLFTLLHEYAHLMIPERSRAVACDSVGRANGATIEAVANQFSASVLLTPEELKRFIQRRWSSVARRRWSDQTLAQISREFFVSKHVVALTLERCGLAAQGFYAERRLRWAQRAARYRGFGRRASVKKTERKVRELGHSAVRVLTWLHEKQLLPLLDAAGVLETKVEKLDPFLADLAGHAASTNVGE